MLESVLVLFLSLQSITPPKQQDEIGSALAHAQALYYGARFTDSIQLLARVDGVLQSTPDRLQDRIDTKLQLALAHIGLNDTSTARSFLLEMYELDSDYKLDPKEFSPKVIALAHDAQVEQHKLQCQNAEQAAFQHIEARNSSALHSLITSMKSKCPALGGLEVEAAELFYKTGLAAYKQSDFDLALDHFQGSLKLNPEHEMASQYVDLTQGKLQLAEERLVNSWQRHFDAHQLPEAAADYKQMVSSKASKQTIARIDGEYRKALTSLVDDWTNVCAGRDDAAISAIQNRILELLPVPSFGEDVRAKMFSCPKPVPPPVLVAEVMQPIPVQQNVTSPTDCLQMGSQFALIHLKSRVDPEIPQQARTYIRNSQVTVRVSMKIDQAGKVTVTDVQGSNAVLNTAVSSAVSQWKFATIRDQNGPRCVETEIPIAIGIAR